MSRSKQHHYPIHFDSRLVEDAVMLAEADLNPLLRLRFRSERDSIYGVEESEERELAFSRFHHRWFDRMELGVPVALAVREHPSLGSLTRRCLVLPAARAGDEEADLRTEPLIDRPTGCEDANASNPPPSIVIRVRPTTLVGRATLRRFLDHEFLHLADMLDPSFGYRPELPTFEGGPARVRQVQERYRVLWDCTIDGRLYRTGKVPREVTAQRRGEFEACFPELTPETEGEFRRWFDGPRPAHEEILGAACSGAPAARSGICPLCRFPYATLHRSPHLLTDEILEAIQAEFPSWKPDHGICTPCADLYHARRAMPQI